MSAVKLGVAVVALALAIENPQIVAKLGLQLEYTPAGKRDWLTIYALGAIKKSYVAISAVYLCVHGVNPGTQTDQIARVLWHMEPTLATQLDILAKWVGKELDSPVEWTPNCESFAQMHQTALRGSTRDIAPKKLGKMELDWVQLGFQGTDPSLDFRGSGMLGFRHFYAFCTKSPEVLRLLEQSESISGSSTIPSGAWYSLALVSIRLSKFLGELLVDAPIYLLQLLGPAHLSVNDLESKLEFLHTVLLVDFHDIWLQKVQAGQIKTILDIEPVLLAFEQQVPLALKQGKLRLTR